MNVAQIGARESQSPFVFRSRRPGAFRPRRTRHPGAPPSGWAFCPCRVLGKLLHKMPLERELIREVRELDQYDLRRLIIFARGLLLAREGQEFEAGGRQARGRATYRQEFVKCGRANCTRCPHGPYWYAYWREGGRLRSRYIGKELPNLPTQRDSPRAE